MSIYYKVNVSSQNISKNNFINVKTSKFGVSSGIRFNFPSLRLLHLMEIFREPLYQRSVDHLRLNRLGDTKKIVDIKSNKSPSDSARKPPNLCTVFRETFMSHGVTDLFIGAHSKSKNDKTIQIQKKFFFTKSKTNKSD